MLKIMIFAALMFVVSYAPFSATMAILRNLYEGRDNPKNYSLVTICATTMWDTVLCLVAFVYAFKDQESLILFILPAFLLCLLFTNLQPRLMMLVFQSLSDNNLNLRQILCRFNLMHYGSLLLIYPILLLTNFNWIMFIGMASVLFPQIYTNGITGIRPDLNSPFYFKYLLIRLSIIFYLRCFPLNIFNLQPDYPLSLICLILIIMQFGLLGIQKIYGAKRVIPKFLLEPVYNYRFEEEINIEEGVEQNECAICLTPIHLDPPTNVGEAEIDLPFKVMKTPCSHFYHTPCLISWMKIKMECPQCRTKLPPYE